MIDITPYQLDIVINILKKYVPHCEVRAFGSRYKWTAKDYSDLDLAIVGNKKLDKKVIYDIKEAFSESDLPIRVDVLDWYAISDEFKQIINQGYEVIQKKEKQLPDGWEIKKLGDMVLISSSKRIFAREYVNSGIPFYRSKEIIQKQSGLSISSELFISIEQFELIKLKYEVPKHGDLLLTSVGTIGIPYVVKNEDFYFKDGNLTWFKHWNGIESSFLYYWFLSGYGKQALSKIVIGSTQKAITINALNNMSILIPPLQKQKQIASILFSLDEKIDINNQINNKLEEIAQALFKQWFVDFNFPDENCSPYKDSGGAMIDSELGKIPKGWQIINLNDYLDFIRGIEPGSKYYSNNKISEQYMQFIRVSDLKSLGDTYIHKSLAKDKLVNEYNVLMSFDGTIGRVRIGFSGAYSSGIRKVVNKVTNRNILNFSNQFVYFLLQTENVQNIIITNATGTTILHAGHTIKLLKIAINNEVMNKFNEIILPLYQQLIINLKETKLLQQIRDTLLPKLISGEIDVTYRV